MNYKMRLKSFAGLFLMFQLNCWFCLLIDASSPIRVVCRFDIEATNITDLYLDICTHIVLNGDLIIDQKTYEEDCKLQLIREEPQDFIKNVKRNRQLKVMLSVNHGFHILSKLLRIRDRKCRNNKNNGTATVEDGLVDFLKEMKFDGLDINVDIYYYLNITLQKSIKQALKRNGLLISFTYNFYLTSKESWRKMERDEAHRLVDFINFDQINYLSVNGLAYHHYPLFQNFPMENNSRFVVIDDEIQKFKIVFEPDQIVIGIPLWSKSWKIPSNVTDTRPPVTAIGESGFVSNREICQGIQTEGWQVFYEDIKRNISPYAVSPITGYNRTWVSFDDPATVVFKLKYALSNKLGGVYLDLTKNDDSNNTCGLGPYPTFMAIARTLNITFPPVKMNKNMSIRCHVGFGFGLLIVVSYVIV